MLSITRSRGQSLTIGDHITVTVLDIRGHEVLLGIDAPPEVPILRDNAKRTEPPK